MDAKAVSGALSAGARCLAMSIFVALLVAMPIGAERPRATPFPPDWPHGAPWKLSRELLLPETERVLFVVDAPRGVRQPDIGSLDHLVQVAAVYAKREASWVRLGGAGGPNVRWQLPNEPSDPVGIILRLGDSTDLDDHDIPQDAVDSARYFAEVPSCPDGPLSSDSSYVFVRYLGQWGSSYGAATTVKSDPSCGARDFRTIYVAQDRIARDRAPFISQSYLERRALTHEYGHVLGLASNPAHGRWGRTFPYKVGPHCIDRHCALAVPTARALLKGAMLDYCAECRRDIEMAREHWLTEKTFPEVPRLPQPDPIAHVARLRNYNFRAGGDADLLVGYGKAAVPPLMKRLTTLPGNRAGSPRVYAAHLVVEIIVAEDRKRRGPAATRLQYLVEGADVSGVLVAWWWQEAERFMGTDDWTLPKVVIVDDLHSGS